MPARLGPGGRQCPAVLPLMLLVLLLGGRGVDTPQAADPDALYVLREDLARAREASSIWSQRLEADAADFESAWKIARAAYWLGGHVPANERRREYERGIAAARRAIQLRPDRPEGHFWLAADMGAMAESFGLSAGIRYRGPVKRALQTALRLDPSFEYGSADRALGRWYDKVPRLFGGSNAKALEHLQRSLTYDPDSAASHFFLAELYLDMDQRELASASLQHVLNAPEPHDWAPETREFKRRAGVLLGRLR